MNLDAFKQLLAKEAFHISNANAELLDSYGNSVNWVLDLRASLLSANNLNFICEIFWSKFRQASPVQVVGLELASVPLMMAIVMSAEKYGCTANAIIVRKSRKKYGLQNKIEGNLQHGRTTIVVDDIVNSGNSIEKCFLALADEGLHPKDIFCVVDYQNEKLKTKLQRKNLGLHSVCTLQELNLPKPAAAPATPLHHYKNLFVFDPKTPNGKFRIFCRSNPLANKDLVFYGTDAAELHAVDSKSGEKSWTAKAVANPYLKGIWSSPCFVEDNICVGAYDGSLLLLSQQDGKQIWSNNYAGYIGSSPAYDRLLQQIYIGLEFAFPGRKGAIAAVSAETGELNWSFEVSDFVHSSPAYSEKLKKVFCASNNGEMYGLDATDGKAAWQLPTYGISKMRPCLSPDQNYLYFTTTMGYVYCLESQTGRVMWTYKTDEHGILASPLIKDGNLYFGGMDGYFYVISAITGALVTKIRTDGRIFSEAGETSDSVIFGNNSGTMFEVCAKSFKIIGRLQLSDRILSKVAYHDGKYFIHLGDDKLMGFERL